MKTFDSEFSFIEVWFTDQNSNPLEIEDNISFSFNILVLAKNMDRNIGKNISNNLSSKYSQKAIDHAKQSTADALKTTSKKTD